MATNPSLTKCFPKYRSKFWRRFNRGGNDGWKVFKIAQTAAFVATSMVPGQELDDCRTDESTER
jgi:hypothetical protein